MYPPGFLTGPFPAHSPLAVTGFRGRRVTVAAVVRAVSVVAVAAGVWASGAVALGPFSDVTNLRDFGVRCNPHWRISSARTRIDRGLVNVSRSISWPS
jgi:hypothetical protein